MFLMAMEEVKVFSNPTALVKVTNVLQPLRTSALRTLRPLRSQTT